MSTPYEKMHSDTRKLLLEEIDNPDNYDLEEAKYIMSSIGLDPDATINEGALWLRKQLAKAKIQAAKSTQQSLLDMAKREFEKLLNSTNETPKNMLIQLLGAETPQFQVNYSKLEKIDDNDILDMLEEAQLLQLIEKIEAKDDTSKS